MAEQKDVAWPNAGEEIKGINLERSRRTVKVNIPDSEEAYRNGNGEGMWGFIRHEEDLENYEKGQGEFEMILLNTSFYWPQLPWGTVIRAEGRGAFNRPTICREQLDKLFAEREAYFKEHPEGSLAPE